jgi:hypothetical protein
LGFEAQAPLFFISDMSLKSNAPVETYTFDFPACIPSGVYLLRIQQLAIHNAWPAGIPQFYTECAQIAITEADQWIWAPRSQSRVLSKTLILDIL